jgi:eukaryotic translation initiation factor 2C
LILSTIQVTLPESGNGVNKRKPRIFQVILRKVGEVNMATVGAYYSGKLRDPDALLQPTMALEVLIRHMMSKRFVAIGRSLYTGEECMALPGGLDAWRGYTLSVRPGESSLMLNINTTTSAFYRPGPLLDYVCAVLEVQDYRDISNKLREKFNVLERALTRIKVYVTHRQGFRPRYTIYKLTRKAASDMVFNIGDTKQTTNVAAYFAKHYNYRLKYPQLPCM